MRPLGSHLSAVLPTILCLLLLPSGHAADDQLAITFHIRNRCPFAIWPAAAPNAGHPVIAGGGFFLPSGMTKRIQAPPSWNGRLWGRTGCDFTNNATSKPGCRTGDCLGLLACNGTVGLPPATLLEVTLQAGRGARSFYDVSLVDGYNLPVSVSSRPADPECFIGGCRRSPAGDCPAELQVTDEDGRSVAACKSACLAFDLDQFCCRNAYATPAACRATAYSRAFKDACPSYVSYAFDTPTPLVACAAKEYVVTFCPSTWSSF
ncbi:hypothetical protein Taro_012612 [Colocasia esculenta]|uniref:Thaumatin-like protein n=1 Tax=Colocasia esculenta TaxID=4460 RepID=A0A843UJL1_COLES|nr:hypothetical protein [Colocasia esculenta]